MTKNAIVNRLLIATIILLLVGCKKGIEKQAEPLSGKKSSTLTTLTGPDVYVAGSEGGQAKYWLNGSAVSLTGGQQATGIAIDGSDVHVCGFGQDPLTGMLVAKYWLNGVATDLSDGTDNVVALGIAVSGGDVYIAGRAGAWVPSGVLWVNGVETSLGSGQPGGIFAAANGDIYIPNQETGNPSYWKNGTLNYLSGGGSSQSVYDVVAVGSDVHVVGFNAAGKWETPLYWKNNTLQYLMNPDTAARAMAIRINSAGGAYISGMSGDRTDTAQIAYWDAVGDLNFLATGEFVATRTGIAIDPATDDLYICGSEFEPPFTLAKAKYWVVSSTGSPTAYTLGSGFANATAIAIALD